MFDVNAVRHGMSVGLHGRMLLDNNKGNQRGMRLNSAYKIIRHNKYHTRTHGRSNIALRECFKTYWKTQQNDTGQILSYLSASKHISIWLWTVCFGGMSEKVNAFCCILCYLRLIYVFSQYLLCLHNVPSFLLFYHSHWFLLAIGWAGA